MGFRLNYRVLTGLLAAFLCGVAANSANAQVAINETVTVHAVHKTDAKSHPAKVEGTFGNAPDPNKDDEIDVDNPGVVYMGAGVCDVLDDQVKFKPLGALDNISVRVLVIGREGVGDVLWVQVQPNGGAGGPAQGGDPNLWADVKDYGGSMALLLKDYVSGRRVSTYSPPYSGGPNLDCDTRSDGTGDVEFWLSPPPSQNSTFSWTITGDGGFGDSGVLPDDDAFLHEEEPLAPGNYSVSVATTNGNPSWTRKIYFHVVAVTSLTVQNATQTNVIGASNWAAAKGSGSDVIITADVNHYDPTTLAELVWTGGDPVPGQPLERKVSVGSTTHVTVTAKLAGTSKSVDIWVIWATVTNYTNGTVGQGVLKGGVKFAGRYDGTEQLGAVAYGANEAVGKVMPVAKLSPDGVNQVVTAGFKFPRWSEWHYFKDGAEDPSQWSEWVDDTSHPEFQNLVPDGLDQIYDRDAPNIGPWGNDSYETYQNSQEWVEWNGTMCSEKQGWYWLARWKINLDPQVQPKEVKPSQIDPFPNANQHFYPPPG